MKPQDLLIRPISKASHEECCKRWHYSKKVAAVDRLFLGVFGEGMLLGSMSFGFGQDIEKQVKWFGGAFTRAEIIELGRMAFSPRCPRNSESRMISVGLRMAWKWFSKARVCVTFANQIESGTGTIYRATGATLAQVKPFEIWVLPAALARRYGKESTNRLALHSGFASDIGVVNGHFLSLNKAQALHGGSVRVGFSLKYLYFRDASARAAYTGPGLDYDKARAVEAGDGRDHRHSGGAEPTPRLQVPEASHA